MVEELEEDCTYMTVGFNKEAIRRHILDILNERHRHVRNGHDYTKVWPCFFWGSCVCSYAPIGKLHDLLDRWIRLRRSNQLRWLHVNQMIDKLKMMSVPSLKTVMVVILKMCFHLIASHVAVRMLRAIKVFLDCIYYLPDLKQSPHFLENKGMETQDSTKIFQWMILNFIVSLPSFSCCNKIMPHKF